MVLTPDLVLAFGIAALVAGGGYAFRALTVGGAAGAVVVGGTVFGLGGPVWGALLVVFFVSSSALSGWMAASKASAAAEFAKGGRRDLGQVVANGGVVALLAAVHGFRPDPALLAAAVGALAAATADTWATEVGLLSRARPRLITTGRPVPPGTSGGVTALGTAAAIAGGLVIGLAALGLESAWAHLGPDRAGLVPGAAGFGRITAAAAAGESAAAATARTLSPALYLVISPAAAFVSAMADSLLGATLQAIHRCPACGVETERRIHRCGAETVHTRGMGWVTNDVVNLLATVCGAAAAWALAHALAGGAGA